MNTKEIDGKAYHCDEGGVLLTYDGEPIPAYVCICAAHSSAECCCGAWDIPLPDENY